MKKFEEFSQVLEYNLPIEDRRYEKLTESEVISLVGGRKNYNRLLEMEYSTNESIQDVVSFFDSVTGSVGKSFMTELIAGLLNPLAKKIGVSKGTILWYMLVYGTQHAFYELGTQILDENKKTDFCKAFAVGVVESTQYWATNKVLSALFGRVGVLVGISSGKEQVNSKLNTSIGIAITNSIKNMLTEHLTDNIVEDYIVSTVCDNKFVNVNGKKQSLWDATTGMGEGVIKGVLKWLD